MKMSRYQVTIKEVWYREVLVEANSPEGAVNEAKLGSANFEEITFYYSHSLGDTEVEAVKDA